MLLRDDVHDPTERYAVAYEDAVHGPMGTPA